MNKPFLMSHGHNTITLGFDVCKNISQGAHIFLLLHIEHRSKYHIVLKLHINSLVLVLHSALADSLHFIINLK